MLNNCTLMGRLTRDPELRRTGSGIAVTSFTIAVDRDVSGKDGEKRTDFFDCVAWRATGEFIAKYFRKGSMIIIQSHAEQRHWTDKDGNKRSAIEFNVDTAYFGEGKKQDNGGNNQNNNGYAAPAGGYAAPPAPAGGGYAAPAGGYAAPPAPAGGGYAEPAGGYAAPAAAPQGYVQPSAPQFAVLEDNDAQLPF